MKLETKFDASKFYENLVVLLICIYRKNRKQPKKLMLWTKKNKFVQNIVKVLVNELLKLIDKLC